MPYLARKVDGMYEFWKAEKYPDWELSRKVSKLWKDPPLSRLNLPC